MIGKIFGQVLQEMFQVEILQVIKEVVEEFLEIQKLLLLNKLIKLEQVLDKD